LRESGKASHCGVRLAIRLLLVLWLTGAAASVAALPPGTRFVMSHFKNDGGGGDERLYISISPDGLNWTALNGGNPVYQPPGWQPFQNVVRDPSIVYANGTYWVAYTSGNYGNHASFGLAKSTDLLSWQYVGEVSTAIPGGTNQLTWSPCFFQDGDGSVHVFVSTSVDQGPQYNPSHLHSYEVHPVSADWLQWSAPVQVQLPESVSNEMWVWKEGETYHAVYIDFLQRASYFHVTSSTLLGPWGGAQLLGYNSQEGGFMLKRPEGGYRFYAETGNSGSVPTYLYSDLNDAFQTLTSQTLVTSTVGMRNGKPIAAPDGTTYDDWRAAFPPKETSSLTDPLGDPDGDSIPNLLEYATGSDPMSGAEPVRIASWGSRDIPCVVYRLTNGLSDIAATPQVSTDLQTWTAATTPLSRTVMSDGTSMFVAESTAGDTSRLLAFRLSVERTSVPTPQVERAEASATRTPPAPKTTALTPAAAIRKARETAWLAWLKRLVRRLVH
jgi:hypothetical protein